MHQGLMRLERLVPLRYAAWLSCVVAAVLCTAGWARLGWSALPALLFGLLAAVGLYDRLQTRRSVLRNYPVAGHLRYLLEYIRPEIRQYFIEPDHEAAPFSRQQRSLVYQRAKGDADKRPFGTQRDMHAQGHEWINHSMAPTELPTHDFRVTIGADRAKPYSASWTRAGGRSTAGAAGAFMPTPPSCSGCAAPCLRAWPC
jgi:glutamate synthase domain-containing protein 2